MNQDDNIKNLITTMIQTKVIEALNDTPEAVGKLIAAAINKPVDPSTGRVDGYGNKVPYIDFLIGEELREAARRIVRDVVQEQGVEQLTALIHAKLSGDEIAKSFAQSVIGAAGREWDIIVSFNRHND